MKDKKLEKENISKENLDRSKEKILREFLNDFRKDAIKNAEAKMKEIDLINFGEVPEEETINAKRNK